MLAKQLQTKSYPSQQEDAPEDFNELWTQYQRTKNPELRNLVVDRYSYIVKCIALKIAGHYTYFNYMEDIISEGLIALMEAFERFDADKGVKFETYASIRVRGAIIDYIRKQDCFPRRLKTMAKSLTESEQALIGELGRMPTSQEMADRLQVSMPEFDKMQAETDALMMLSFEEMVYEKGVEAIPIHAGDPYSDMPDERYAEKELQEILAQSIELLSEKEQLVISLYYKEQVKIKDIADILEIGASRVSQIHSSALRKLQTKMKAYYEM